MSREIVWHEVPGNPGCLRVGHKDLNVKVKCLPSGKTEWTIMLGHEFNIERNNVDYRIYAEIHGNQVKIFTEDLKEIMGEIPDGAWGTEVYISNGKIVFLPRGIARLNQ